MLSYWPCQRLNVVMLAWQQQPAPPPLLARGASHRPTDWLPLLSLSPCRRCAEPRPAVLELYGASRAAVGARRL